ncbi:MAG: hypothetical protein FWH32_02745 [Clostridiales bacterium]|nr:hypothetical protein [Clostridiales bacterium]
MNILITAGGTSERIDDVRRITNLGTGALGARVAEAFAGALASEGQECCITYICSKGSVRPSVSVDVRVADDVGAVEATVRQACAEREYDIVVHSMAIGDYRVRAVSDAGLMTGAVMERLSYLACGDSSSPEEAVRDALLSPPDIKAAKISSDKEDLVVVLERAPKIIALYRELAPRAVLVGFKLLSDASEDDLVSAACALLEKNGCDFVLANDMGTVRAGAHEGLLVGRSGTCERAESKEGIAGLIVRHALESVRQA